MEALDDIIPIVAEFKNQSEPNDRYSSFDYCYNYFKQTKPKELTNDMEKSCLVLGFYLASWGMFRGSSFLLQRSVKHFEPTIKYLATLDNSIWEIDIDKYTDGNITTLLQIYFDLKRHIDVETKTHLTVVTKVMLGVFGFIPAYDQYFLKSFSKLFKGQCAFTSVNRKSLTCLKEFYDANYGDIDNLALQTFTTDFSTGQKTKLNYPKAKIVDMYGFTSGLNMPK